MRSSGGPGGCGGAGRRRALRCAEEAALLEAELPPLPPHQPAGHVRCQPRQRARHASTGRCQPSACSCGASAQPWGRRCHAARWPSLRSRSHSRSPHQCRPASRFPRGPVVPLSRHAPRRAVVRRRARYVLALAFCGRDGACLAGPSPRHVRTHTHTWSIAAVAGTHRRRASRARAAATTTSDSD